MEVEISKESAEETIKGFLDFYDIDPDNTDVSSKVLHRTISKIKRAITQGRLEAVDGPEGPTLCLHLSKEHVFGAKLVFGIVDGSCKVCMSGNEEDNHYKNIYQLVAALTKTPVELIEKVQGKDLTTMEAIGSVFLLV